MVLMGAICIPESEGYTQLVGCLRSMITRTVECMGKCHEHHACPVPTPQPTDASRESSIAIEFIRSIAIKFKECTCRDCAVCAGKCLISVGLGEEHCNLITVVVDIAQMFGAPPPLMNDTKSILFSIVTTIMRAAKFIEAV
ncbi:hypothetical protein Ciccas_003714 [Cichlidogyrus casuarinus]|uniref:Uncharacterized protein n=1 Tax=Cichlidogyrus casuarinus TaxID=1844966 RepID=A0ABD2QDL4_9PLAT